MPKNVILDVPADRQNQLVAMFGAGRFAEVEAHARMLVDWYPKSGFAWKVLGAALQEQQKDAIAALQRATVLAPRDPDAYNNFGNELTRLGRLLEALETLQRAIALAPLHPQAHNNLGNVLTKLGQLNAAVNSYRNSLKINPNYAEAYNNLGVVLKEMGELDEAEKCFAQALQLKPDYAEAHNGLGVTLQRRGQIDESVESYRRALVFAPNFARAHNNLGTALKSLDRLEEAAASYRRALQIAPDFADAYSNLLYLYAFTKHISPEAQRELAAGWEIVALSESERKAARNIEDLFHGSSVRLSRVGRRLKIGVMSAELGQHAVTEFLMPFLEQIDRSRFHVSLYPTTVRYEARVEKLRALADDFKSLVGLSDEDAAAMIRADHIDVLIDTTAHLMGSRLGVIARRAAPVQCHYIGYHGTTGLTEMDWFIGDDALIPAALDGHFTERIWRLPRLWIVYKGDLSLPLSQWQPRSDGLIWLGSFNNLAKVREETLALWAKVMNALPQSRLVLKDRNAISAGVRDRIIAVLDCHGIGRERVEFAGHTPDWQSHMAMYDQIDIALDPIPLNSGTTAFDALWMGVPLVSIEGNWMGARMTSAMLRALGKAEWVAQTEDEYVAIVTSLAKDVAGRTLQRSVQRKSMAASPLCDAVGLTRAIEDAFEKMVDRRIQVSL